MRIYIIAKYTNIHNEAGYMLLDTDDNNKTMIVSKQQLINVLKAKKLKLHNAKLVGNHISGTYYSLDILPRLSEANGIEANNNWICLSNYLDIEFTVCKLTNHGVVVNKLNDRMLKEYMTRDTICNLDTYTNKLLCEKIDAGKPNNRNLDLEVTDETIPWTIEDFHNYMRKYGYTYELKQEGGINIKTYSLDRVDVRCTKLKIPVGVKYIDYMYNGRIEKIDSLIIPKSVTAIRNLWQFRDSSYRDTVTITNLKFQEFTDAVNLTFMGSGLCHLVIPGDFIPPKHERLHEAFSNCNIRHVPKLHYRDTVNCFANLKLNNSELNLDIEEIKGSFSPIFSCPRIKILEGVNIISNSIIAIDSSVVDFTKAINLRNIEHSFESMYNVREIDLSKCNKLTYFTECFNNCQLLKTVKLNEGLTSITKDVFKDSLVEELELPRSLLYLHANTHVKRIIVPDNINKLNGQLMNAWNVDSEFIFKSSIIAIEKETFDASITYTDFSKIKADFSKTILQQRAFKNSSFYSFDSRMFPLNDIIPEECFLDCDKLSSVIIGNNIKVIDDYAFKNCIYLSKVAVAPSVRKISLNAFAYTHSKTYTIFYVVKDSYAAKFFKNSKRNYTVREFDTFEDAVNYLEDDSLTSEQVKAKYPIILNDTKYRVLLNKPYDKYISKSFSIIRTLENTDVFEGKLNLDTSKFIFENISSLNELGGLHDFIRDSYNKKSNEINIDMFVGLCNLITRFSNNHPELYKESIWYNPDITFEPNCVLYSDSQNIIGCIKVTKGGNKVIPNKLKKLKIIFVMYNQDIVYLTTFNDSQYDFLGCNQHLLSYKTNKCTESVGSFIDIGDLYNSFGDIKIGGAVIPDTFIQLIANSLKYNFIYIGTISTVLSDKKIDSRKYNILLYDILTMKFFELQAKVTFAEIHGIERFNDIQSFIVRNVYNFDEIDKIDEYYINDFKYQFESTLLNRQASIISLSQEDINKQIEQGNYDSEFNDKLVEFADCAYKYNVKNKEDLSYSIADALLGLEFFKDANVSINKCVKDKLDADIIPIKNSDKYIIYYRVDYGKYYYGIIDEKTALNRNDILKESRLTIDKVLNILYMIGEYRANSNDKTVDFITNNPINTDKYIFLKAVSPSNEAGFKINIAIEKYTGYSCLVTEKYDVDFCLMFKFKNLLECYDVFDEITDENSNLSTDMHSLKEKIHINSNPRMFIELFRQELIDGLPLGIPSLYDIHTLEDKVVRNKKCVDQ